MDFQLISATIEDRLPPGIPDGVTFQDFLSDDFLDVVGEPLKLEKSIDGACVAFLFGRMQDGRSICIRVEGIRPKLFFDYDGNLDALKRELQQEVYNEIRFENYGLIITKKEFANFNGYEPDDTTASGRKVHLYYQVEYPSMRTWRKAVSLRKSEDELIRSAIKEKTVIPGRTLRVAHEYNVDPTTRFLREGGLLPGGWNTISFSRPVTTRVTGCDVEVETSMEHISALRDRFQMSPYCVLYYDLETLSLDPESGAIIQMSMVFARGDAVEKHLVSLGSVAPLEGTTLHCMGSEEGLLRRARRLVVEKDPDFMVAYNGVNFDNKFLVVRAEARHAAREKIENFFFLSRFLLRPCRLRELSLASSGMGDNKFDYIDMPGRATVDFFVKFKVDEPSEISWSLSHFVRKYIPGEDKEDMDYRDIPKLQAGTPEDRRKLASYCVHDSYLLHLLNKSRNIIVIILQFAQVFGVLPEWVYFRGQQVRFISQVLEGARNLEQIPLLLQTPKGGFVGMYDTEGFEGATVNDPLTGFYDAPIPTLDWKSLYPSIMLAHNLCHSTHILEKELRTFTGVVAHHVRTLGVHWREIDANVVFDMQECDNDVLRRMLQRRRREALLKDKDPFRKDARGTTRQIQLERGEWQGMTITPQLTPNTYVKLDDNTYVQPVGEHSTYFTTKHKGILPRILENLLAERAFSKKQIKENLKKAKEFKESDPEAATRHLALADVFDGRQLALKVSANSVYGATGAGASGKMPNKDVSETVTFEGRETMVILKEMLQSRYPGIVIVYGDTDSVMVMFEGITEVKVCAKLAHEAADFVTDEFARRGFPDMQIEFEKVFYPYLLLKKKRYIGIKYEPNGDDMECKGIDAKGVETERKDTLPFLKKIYMDVRNELMYNKDAYAALKQLEKHLWCLVRNEVPFEDLILSKGLRGTYKDESTLVQCCVNEKKRLRQPGSESAVGDRVWYVIVNGPLGSKTTDLAEDPAYVKEHNLKLNRLWYFEHAIEKPMASLFSHIKQVNANPLFATIKAELERERVGGTSLRGLVDASVASSSMDTSIVGVKHHVPRPPPPLVRKKKKN